MRIGCAEAACPGLTEMSLQEENQECTTALLKLPVSDRFLDFPSRTSTFKVSFSPLPEGRGVGVMGLEPASIQNFLDLAGVFPPHPGPSPPGERGEIPNFESTVTLSARC